MDKMERALRELGQMDELAAGDSPVHRLSPWVKLLVTLGYIIAVVSFDKYALSGILPLILYPLLVSQLSGVSLLLGLRKLRLVLPLVLAVGIFNPFLDRAPLLYLGSLPVSGGVVSMLTLLLKGLLSLLASFLLVATTPIDSLCAGLRKLRVPQTLVTLLLLTYRYVGVMMEELAVMSRAYHLRAPGQKGIHYKAWGSFLGQLLLRSMDRAGELYASMRLRSFHGEFYYAPSRPCGGRDLAWLLLWLGAFALLRLVDLGALLGGLLHL